MNWDDLRYILAVSRAATVLEAARSLRVSPTTMARRLRSLEASQGTALFEKFKHGTVLSEAGHRVVEVAAEVERMTAQLDAEIHGLDRKLEGSIRVTSVDFLLRHWVEDFGEFRTLYPGVDLELTSTLSVVNLTQRDADVALRVARTAPEHLLGARHAEFMYAVYGGQALTESREPDAPYSAFPWLSWDLAFARSTDEWIEKNAAGADISMRFGQMSVMVDAVAAGLGLTILPCLIGDAHPGLNRVGTYFEGGLHLWVLTHPQLRGSARISAFTRFVRERIRRDLDLIEGRRPRSASGIASPRTSADELASSQER
ncbi:MAG: LysR family transcriptional regulator [Nannocystales bacterium]